MLQINWDNFKTYNQDVRGVHYKFESLCRLLFANENLSGNKQFRYLHANPNNYGLETEPIFDENRQLWIGFQAKFFDGDVDYTQIKHSAEKIVEYYTGKVDLVFLFCNKEITSTAKSFVSTVNLLKQANIDIQLITDKTILDLVIGKYPYLGFYYFGNHMLSQDWFVTHTNHMYDNLGEQYNKEFNVETEAMNELSLFVHDQRAADYLNAKKTNLLSEIEELYRKRNKYRDFLTRLRDAVVALPNVDVESLYEALDWENTIEQKVHSNLDRLKEEILHFKEQQHEINQNAFKKGSSQEERQTALDKTNEINQSINELSLLINLPQKITINERERSLLFGRIMKLTGKAGVGKSQLLASETKFLFDSRRTALFLVAGIYFTEEPIQEQIMKNLRLGFSFEELIDILETLGEKENCIVPIFIDALNETWNNRLWRVGLFSIIDKLKNAPMVKLVVSYRQEYQKLILPDSLINGGKEVVEINHRGFEDNSIEAVREFLNHHNIPFTPMEYFGFEMSNPLFLTLYCKTYNGEEVDLPTLYERLLEKANTNIYHSLGDELKNKGYSETELILKPLISQIADYFVRNNVRIIPREELISLGFWGEYGLAPASYISSLIKENILYVSTFDDVEKFYFAYDQMADYYCAKIIIKMHSTKAAVKKYLSEKVLRIESNRLEAYENIDLFVNACVLFAEKYGEECIDIIDELTEDNERGEVFSRYITAFEWRKTTNVTGEAFIELLQKYPCEPYELWSMLIGNSIKVSHPFNADFLHEFLSHYELNRRDYLWTIYINKLTWDESDRVVQLIQMYDQGEKLEVKNEKQVELLLTLFGWLLTSSNRWLRDYTSKAMVEILKEHFDLCKPLLEKFKSVNDPYVLQRLYGVIFGASCKRNSGNLKDLAEYIYESIFNQEKVYPDILLRDYARLIIEKFISEEPEANSVIDRQKIIPPYKSDPIPEINDQHYEDLDWDGAMLRLRMSMRVDMMGGYGDFGRYVFQYALSNFEVDMKMLYNYAVYHIINDLGFNEEYFGEHDCYFCGYERKLTNKIERIGKKYQWITLYEMLARVSDNCKMVDRWSYPEEAEEVFEGAWNPYVRDFDPTLNAAFMICADAPLFRMLEEHRSRGIEENEISDISTPELQKKWLERKGAFYEGLKGTLILTDDKGQQWVTLKKHCDTRKDNLNVEKLSVWSWLYAYFMTPKQADEFSRSAEKGLPIISSEIASHHETYTIFNREYPWSPSCRDFEEYAWVDAKIKTGEIETITETTQLPDLSAIEQFLHEYDGIYDEGIQDVEDFLNENGKEEIDNLDDKEAPLRPWIRYREETRKQEVEKDIGRILHATTDLHWEEEYDATKEETISRSLPCGKLINMMGLRQIEADGFFYDKNGKLAAFDTGLTQKINSVVVRKDILDCFLSQTGLKLVWLVDAEKGIHAGDYTLTNWSDWEAVYIYESDHISGDIHRLPEGNLW